MQGRPGQQAAAETEPKRSVCRSKAMKQHNALILPDLFFLGYVLTDDRLVKKKCGEISPERHGCSLVAQAVGLQLS